MRLWKFGLTLLSATLFAYPAWSQEVWTTGTFETEPTDSQQASAGAGRIRDTRQEIRSRFEVEHYIANSSDDDTNDDNGLHRLGSARCFMGTADPTTLSDTAKDHANTGVTGETDLDNSAFNSDGLFDDDLGHGRCYIDLDGADGEINEDCTALASPTACCTGTDTGTCNEDNNKMYIYIGVAGDAGSCATGYDCAWQEVKAEHDSTTEYPRVKAGATDRNILFNGDFDYDACTGTADPTGWTSIDSETVAYEVGAANQGIGCAIVVTDVDGGDGYSQVLTNVKGGTTYRVTAQVKETDSSDICTLATTGASTQVTGMVSDGTSYLQLDGFFITSAALDTVTLTLTNTAAGDICTWDHIGVYRQEAAEVPEAGIIAVYDTYTDSASVATEGTGYEAVPTLSVAFRPPTENWIVHVGATVSAGCAGDCNMRTDEGIVCRLEAGGSELAGTVQAFITDDDGGANDVNIGLTFNYIDINPVAGTTITYTVDCQEDGPNDIVFNFTTDSLETTDSNLWFIAYPPH